MFEKKKLYRAAIAFLSTDGLGARQNSSCCRECYILPIQAECESSSSAKLQFDFSHLTTKQQIRIDVC